MAKTPVVDRALQMAPRGWKHQIDQSIRGDVVKALVELVLNCDDSYRQLEAMGHDVSGLIEIRIDRRRGRPSIVVIRDEAAGISGTGLDRAVGRYGEATASAAARGFFGRGLKEAILGLGHGTIRTTCEGVRAECSLKWSGDEPRYTRYRDSRAVKGERGTEISLVIERDDVDIRIPHTENLAESLERYFSLRDVMTNPNRRVVVVGGPRVAPGTKQITLSYSEPVGEVLEESVCEVPGFDKQFTFRLVRADTPLTSPADEGALAPGGMVVSSEKGILALTLFKYSHDTNAERLYGRVHCEALDDLILRNEPILKATREVDGVIWTHPFARTLRAAIDERLKPHIEAEARRNKAKVDATADRELRQRLAAAVRELNAIASGELGSDLGVEPEPMVPEGGFGFVPEYVQVLAYKEAALYVRTVTPGVVPEGTQVSAFGDGPSIEILTPTVCIERNTNHEGLGRAKVLVKGKVVGAEEVVTAQLPDGRLAQALVKVISKRIPPDNPPPPPRPRGLFDDVRPDPEADPRRRVFVRDHIIWIATQAPTVRPYIGATLEGARDTPDGQVMMAELVAEGFCRELAFQRVQKGRIVFPAGGEADAREREFRRLHNQYGHRIHELFVRRNGAKGRPTSAESADRAAAPL